MLGHLSFSLHHMDINRSLVVGGSGKHLALSRRYGGIAINNPGKNSAQGFNTQRQRGYIQKNYIADFSGQHPGLDGRADGDNFIRIDAFKGLFTDKILNRILYRRYSGRTSHQDDLINLTGL